MSVKEMGQLLNRYYNTTIYSKGKSRYDDIVYETVEDLQEDEQELNYLFQDVYITYKYLELMAKQLPIKYWKLTTGSTALDEWYRIFGHQLLISAMQKKQVWIVPLIYKNRAIGDNRVYKRYKFSNSTKKYTPMNMYKELIKRQFPVEWLYEKAENGQFHYDVLRNWYSGGLVMVNERYRGRLVPNITGLDINSSYPSQMYKDAYVPYGMPTIGDDKRKPFKFYKMIVRKKLVNKKGLPFLSTKLRTEYKQKLSSPDVYYFTSIEYARIKKYYKLTRRNHFLYIAYSFSQLKIKDIFSSYIDKYWKWKLESKEEQDEGKKTVAKLFLNSLYGKMAQKFAREGRFFNYQTSDWFLMREQGKVDTYFPLGVCITALARMSLVDAVGTNYSNFVYCDTDSLYLKDFKPKDYNIDLHPSRLGAWDVEYKDIGGLFRRPKQYVLFDKDLKPITLTVASINFQREGVDTSFLKVRDFILGQHIPNQIRANRLPTGVQLEELDKDIYPQWNYKRYPLLTEQKPLSKTYLINNFNKELRKITINKPLLYASEKISH